MQKYREKLKTLGVDISEKRLHNLFYCGLITSKILPGEIIEGRLEPMVTRDLFLQVNNIRQENRVHCFVHYKDNENLPLKVFTKCEKCGTPLTGYLVKKKGIYYYKCRTKGCRVYKSAKSLHQLFKNLVSAFHIDKDEQEVIKVVLSEQMNVFFKSKSEDSKKLKAQKTEIQKKLDAIEERFVKGEIDRSLYDKFKPKFEKEIIEIEQELNTTGNYSSNLNKALKLAATTSSNLLNIWALLNIDSSKVFQNLLFPKEIYYNHENNEVRAPRVIFFLSNP